MRIMWYFSTICRQAYRMCQAYRCSSHLERNEIIESPLQPLSPSPSRGLLPPPPPRLETEDVESRRIIFSLPGDFAR